MSDLTDITISKLKENLFRYNNEKNTSYTLQNAPLDLLGKMVSLPKFILNAINFANIKTALEAQQDKNAEAVLSEITEIAKPKLQNVEDQLSYWLMEVEPHKLVNLINYCEANKINLADLDYKLNDTLNKYRIYMDAGIQTHEDLKGFVAQYHS